MESGWGQGRPADIRVLLKDTASHLNRLLRHPFSGVVVVVPAPPEDPVPRTHYRAGSQDPFIVQLSSRDRRWAQFAYQFSHEFCHILSGYERLRNNPNQWFHEAICETASIFTIRRMAESWVNYAPFPNWTSYAGSLADYAEERFAGSYTQLPKGVALRDWLSQKEDGLRKDPYQRQLNEVLAYAMLPLFESNPMGWNAVASLPDSAERLHSYLQTWRSEVDVEDRSFVELILGALK